MSRKRNILHSQERHRNRRYKRRIRNLLIEILFIILLVSVAIKFIKNDEDKPTVSQLGTDEQKQIIDNEMKENNNIDNENERELQIPEFEKEGIAIVKAIITFTNNQKQSILNIDVINYGEQILSKEIPVNIVNDSGDVLEETYVNVSNLEAQTKIRLNIVCENDLREATKIELRDERVY